MTIEEACDILTKLKENHHFLNSTYFDVRSFNKEKYICYFFNDRIKNELYTKVDFKTFVEQIGIYKMFKMKTGIKLEYKIKFIYTTTSAFTGDDITHPSLYSTVFKDTKSPFEELLAKPRILLNQSI